MKNLLLGLNIVLLAAVAFLYYKNFSGKATPAVIVKDTAAVKTVDTATRIFNVAYVDFDSLNAKIVYLKQHRKDIEQEQKNIETDAANAYKKLEDKQKDFVQKNPNATPEQIQKIRTELMEGQQSIESSKQEKMQQLNQRSFTLLEEVKSKLRNFITEYNKDKRYQYILMTGTGLDYIIYKDTALDITQDVIRGLNEKMKVK
jgi:outer membrane protein